MWIGFDYLFALLIHRTRYTIWKGNYNLAIRFSLLSTLSHPKFTYSELEKRKMYSYLLRLTNNTEQFSGSESVSTPPITFYSYFRLNECHVEREINDWCVDKTTRRRICCFSVSILSKKERRGVWKYQTVFNEKKRKKEKKVSLLTFITKQYKIDRTCFVQSISMKYW